MENKLLEEFRRLSENASLKREFLLAVARGNNLRRKRLTLAAGILALLSAATVTSLLADYTPAPVTKIVAVILSTASGFISLLGNIGFKDREIQDLYAGAARYLALRENSHRISFNEGMGVEEKYRLLEEMQELYSQLDDQFIRYIEEQRPPRKGRSALLGIKDKIMRRHRGERAKLTRRTKQPKFDHSRRNS